MKLALALFFLGVSMVAQTVSIRGVVTDESGAVVPGAKVTLQGLAGVISTTVAGSDGGYTFAGMPAGDYKIQASAPDLAMIPLPINAHGATVSVNLQLKVATTVQQVTVQDNSGPAVTPDPANNASALTLQGQDLQALSDDPDDLASDLQALAGPAAGPNGGAIYIDGFSGGQMPSKDSIREIRINQNPFSPEYDKLGYGRVEIFTKPGSDKFHGTVFYNFGDEFWNSRNPYAARKAPFLLQESGGNIGGPLSKRASFFLDIRRDAVANGAIINGVTLDPNTLLANPFTQVFTVPQRRMMISPRLDYQLSKNNTLVVRYLFGHADIQDAGIGGFNLTSRGYHVTNGETTLQATETAIISASIVNETRFQYFRNNLRQVSNSADPAIQVLNSFTGGGAQLGHSSDIQNNYEFQDYVSIARGAHAWRFGARLRDQTEQLNSPTNFGGTFTFGGSTLADGTVIDSIDGYQRTLQYQQLGYLPSQIRALGGGATQFSINAGNPLVSASQFDLSAFAGDDWRIRPNLTLSLGLRYETQTNIHDRTDFAPRLGIAWAPGAKASGKGRPKTVIRGGFGMFYDRFALANTLTSLLYNGTRVQQYILSNPDFYPMIPPLTSLPGLQSSQIVQKVSPDLSAPYIMNSAVSLERQLPLSTTIAVTYANSHGLHMLRSRVYGQEYVMESTGLYNQNQMIVNVNSRVNSNVSIFGAYMENRTMSNTDGIGTFPANPLTDRGEYGPAATDIHHRASIGGSLNTRWNIRLSPFVIVESGPPFNITAGRDIYGTTLFNARPGIATDLTKPGLIHTAYGWLDPNPTPDEQILPRNYGRGPGQIMVNVRLSKTFNFGPAKEGSVNTGATPGDMRRMQGGPFGGGAGGVFGGAPANRRFNLVASMQIRNLLNHTNPGPIIGNITSPLFGQANQTAGGPGGGGFSEAANNRRLELQLRLTF